MLGPVAYFTSKHVIKKNPILKVEPFLCMFQIQTMVESLKLSITDQQLPMFIRILELIIALYYGEIGGHKEGEGEEGSSHVRETGAILSGE